jgi:hypothetical protein
MALASAEEVEQLPFTDQSLAADPPIHLSPESRLKHQTKGFISSLIAAFGATGPRAERGLCEAKGSSWRENRTLAGNSNLATAAALIVLRSGSTTSLAIWALIGFFKG